MIGKFVIAAALLVMPVQALAQDVPVKLEWLDAEKLQPVCKAMTERALASSNSRKVIDDFNTAMERSGLPDGTRAAIMVACALYVAGRADEAGVGNSF